MQDAVDHKNGEGRADNDWYREAEEEDEDEEEEEKGERRSVIHVYADNR